MIDKSKNLRQLFSGSKLIRVLGAHDALGAKLIECAGFDGVWASGLEISTSCGVPDANILTMTDFLNSASSINEATTLPVVADCDTGFGNSNNVIHMVKKYEAAGIAAVCIEDKHFPKVNSFIAGRQELASISEFVGKILAAKNAQTNPDFMVIARVEALIAGWGMEEAIRRANAYVDSGADAILIHSKSKTIDEIAEFVKLWKNRAPVVVVPTTYFNVKAKELEKLKIRMVIYANHGIRASIKAMQETFSKIYSEGNTALVEPKIASMQEVFELQGMRKMKENELIYSGSDDEKVTAIIPVAGDHLEEYSMKAISQDIPIAMLDVNGKPLLQRQAEALNRCKIYDIKAVGGYKKEKISVDGVKVVSNARYKATGILYSIMCALNQIKGPVLITYGDVLFDHFLINELLNKSSDIVLVADNTYDAKRMLDKKRAELLVADVKIRSKRRTLYQNGLYKIKKVGRLVRPQETNLEFCGILFLSKNGVKTIKANYLKYEKRYKNKKSSDARNFGKLNLVDFLQELIMLGHEMNCLVVNSGWVEVNSLADYKYACSIFR